MFRHASSNSASSASQSENYICRDMLWLHVLCADIFSSRFHSLCSLVWGSQQEMRDNKFSLTVRKVECYRCEGMKSSEKSPRIECIIIRSMRYTRTGCHNENVQAFVVTLVVSFDMSGGTCNFRAGLV